MNQNLAIEVEGIINSTKPNWNQIRANYAQISSKGEEDFEGDFGAPWEKQVPKDESHIPYKLSMEGYSNSNGEFSFFKLGSSSSMEVGKRGCRERIIWFVEFRGE